MQCTPMAPVTLSCLNGLEPSDDPELVFELLCAMRNYTLEHLKENGCPEKKGDQYPIDRTSRRVQFGAREVVDSYQPELWYIYLGEQSADEPRFVFAKYHIPTQSSSPRTLTTVRVSW